MDKSLELALQALKDGIIIKCYDNDCNEFFGEDLYIVFYQGEYQLGVSNRQGYLAVKDFGKVWTLRPANYYDSATSEDTLFQELYEENFGV